MLALSASLCSAALPKGEPLAVHANFIFLPRPLPLRKDFPRPGEDVAQRQKGECGTAIAVTERARPFAITE